MMKPIKVYELYPSGDGFSAKTIDYRGHIIAVAAKSAKQAYYFAGNNVWANHRNNPQGILWTYNKWANGPDHIFFNGSKGYGTGEPRHGDGQRIITEWMDELGVREENANVRT